MTREQALETLKEMAFTAYGHRSEALEMAISALSAQPCDDAISRKDLIIKLNAWDCKSQGIPNYAWKVINEMPPVQPIIPNMTITVDDSYMRNVRRDCGLYE